ncbi:MULTISPECIES: F0F1 ATP synthase subunit A [unclassified Adlercreutzia]|uniref:F0F1 ATP synthase subunit A n=1 Tax=unclassified Adlercreutzia TaxID=2636013 RepID=UPI0013EC5FF5|nr:MULTISPECIES: F0F1 ATP synthase subunit A [unclassified Adlercreutzia]
MELTGNPLADIAAPIEHLRSSFDSAFVVDFGGFGITQYTLWMFIVLAVVLAVVLIGVRKIGVVPNGKFAGMVEWGYDAVKRNMGEGAIGHGYKKHIPFLATLFFFILTANVIGLIPGAKAATGTLGVTWALSFIAFVYFNYYGIKAKGGLGYIKSIAPSGLPKPMVPIIWFFEFISLVIRLLTLAVRLYGNMFAGHMVLGIFALLTTVFIQDAIYAANAVLALPSIIWMLFLIAMYVLECLVAFLQAYVFTILSAVYIGLATSEH